MKTSRYIGVSRLPGNGKLDGTGWGVTISINGISTWLGSFKEDEELLAAKVYDAYCFFHRYDRINPDNNLKYVDNGLLLPEERNEILKSGIPEQYAKKIQEVKALPKGISRRGNKFRVCIQSKGRKFEKIVSSLDEAILVIAQQRKEWNQK